MTDDLATSRSGGPSPASPPAVLGPKCRTLSHPRRSLTARQTPKAAIRENNGFLVNVLSSSCPHEQQGVQGQREDGVDRTGGPERGTGEGPRNPPRSFLLQPCNGTAGPRFCSSAEWDRVPDPGPQVLTQKWPQQQETGSVTETDAQGWRLCYMGHRQGAEGTSRPAVRTGLAPGDQAP